MEATWSEAPKAPFIHPRLRMMAHINRWGVMPKHWSDKVSSHSWFVAVYSLLIADLIQWEGKKHVLLTAALLHDLDEMVTGDICWPIKPAIIDHVASEQYADNHLTRLVPRLVEFIDREPSIEAGLIVKAADRLDALLECSKEVAFCNGAMGCRVPSLTEQLEKAWMELPGQPKEFLRLLWVRDILPCVLNHRNANMYDIEG